MSSPAVAFRYRRGAHFFDSPATLERRVLNRVRLSWALLFLNVLTFAAGTWNGLPLIVPIPATLGKVITQGALPAALLVALTVNRRLAIRPNVFLCLLTLLALEAVLSGTHPAGHLVGTLYRTARLAGFVATLWALSPWWGRRDLLLLRFQLTCLGAVLGAVLLGLLIAPGRALDQGRLSGVFWPTPPTQVADFAAITIGLVVLLWLCHLLEGRVCLLVVTVVGAMLLLTHSRTELIAMTAGVFVGGLSIFMARARVRRLFASGAVLVSIVITAFSGVITSWLIRGESSQELTSLTGRTTVWEAVLKSPRDPFQVIFGYGLSNKSFNGFPVDSNWLAAYLDLGLIGVVISAMLVLFVFAAAYFAPRGPQRALALFLVTYLVVNSVTATGLSDASVAMVELALAASLLVVTPQTGQLE